MNITSDETDFSASPKKIDWKRIAIIAVVLGVAGYTWYSENFGDNQGGGAAVAERQPQNNAADKDYEITFDASKNFGSKDLNSSAKSNSRTGGSKSTSSGPYLKPTGKREDLQSPAGLIYSGGREHRRDHVLRHANDIPERDQPHGVFHADGDDVFRLIDEAYELVKKKSKQVKTKQEGGGKTSHVVDMKREIGFKGGRVGKRQNFPKLYKVKLVLGENRVITAYPY
jgi:hypothetical protein